MLGRLRNLGGRAVGRQRVWVPLGAALLLLALIRGFRAPLHAPESLPPQRERAAGGGCVSDSGRDDGGAASGDEEAARHPLLEQIARDLLPFNLSGISLREVEQAYCQGSRSSMRVQVRGGNRHRQSWPNLHPVAAAR